MWLPARCGTRQMGEKRGSAGTHQRPRARSPLPSLRPDPPPFSSPSTFLPSHAALPTPLPPFPRSPLARGAVFIPHAHAYNPPSFLLAEVSFEGVGEEVFGASDALDIFDLGTRRGQVPWGPMEPRDQAAELLDATLRPFLESMDRYREMRQMERPALASRNPAAMDLPRESLALNRHEGDRAMLARPPACGGPRRGGLRTPARSPTNRYIRYGCRADSR